MGLFSFSPDPNNTTNITQNYNEMLDLFQGYSKQTEVFQYAELVELQQVQSSSIGKQVEEEKKSKRKANCEKLKNFVRMWSAVTVIYGAVRKLGAYIEV
ncbi:hypothetical protein TNIN_250291 [Trichonephila inaurata madagascariensis]|uniref:Uncharacterized protein n=1 Tax=Trichonephila inaurata madagascariensis TaxID=2747483 RepID=A0A8X6Y570_9ARAC|nr:hypothetical protein TNIN_250291 [Trichonephila inaurata madagascariensis]